jgi:microcystin-dependent protein
MSKRAFLTPNSPNSGQFICWPLWLPDSVEFFALAMGALCPLCYDFNWEQVGELTPEETAQLFVDALSRSTTGERCMEIGTIVLFAGAGDCPAFFLDCDGSEVPQADYPLLYAALGNTWGSAASGYFCLPDLRGRAPFGAGAGSGLTPRSLADTGGQETHQLTVDEMPSHHHTTHTHGMPLVTGLELAPVSTPSVLTANTGNTGGDSAHENMPPFVVLRFIIRAL